MRSALAAAPLVLLFLAAPTVSAQGTPPSSPDATGSLAGRVVFQDQPVGVPYATVTLTPTGGSRFADSAGAFIFTRLEPGAYHVRARQIGYSPADTTVQVRAGVVTTVTVRLKHVARLARITVRAKGSRDCVKPGVPDSTVDPELAQIFAQVRENVLRLHILETEYPFRYHRIDQWMARDATGDHVVDGDTVNIDSWSDERYEPGRVVSEGMGRHGGMTSFMHLVQFQDIGDLEFEQTHCFTIADHDPGQPIEVDFRPAVSIPTPDIEGSLYLDPDKYILERAVFHLTRSREARIRDWTYSTTYREVVPLVPVAAAFHSIVQQPGGESIEDGRVVDYNFIREAPVDPSVHDTLAGAATVHTIVAQATFATSATRACTPPPPQNIVESFTGTLLRPPGADAAVWGAAARSLLLSIQSHMSLPSTLDLDTFGYPAPASARDAAGRGAVRVSPGIFGRYALTLNAGGIVEDVRVVTTSLSSDVDSAVTLAARGAASKSLANQTVMLSVSTTPETDTLTSVPFAHVQAPSWLLTRGPTLPLAPASPVAGDTAFIEFVVDDTGHPVLPTVHRVGSPADMDSLTVAAADSLNAALYQPALVGRCPVSQIATRRFVFRHASE